MVRLAKGVGVAIDIRANAKAKDRRGRIFVTDIKQVQPALIEALSARFIEEDDLEREPLLEELLRTTLIVAWVYPGIEPDDIAQVYLQPLGGGERLFACTVVPRTRLEQMLAETPADALVLVALYMLVGALPTCNQHNNPPLLGRERSAGCVATISEVCGQVHPRARCVAGRSRARGAAGLSRARV